MTVDDWYAQFLSYAPDVAGTLMAYLVPLIVAAVTLRLFALASGPHRSQG